MSRKIEKQRRISWTKKVILSIFNLLVVLALLGSILKNYNKFEILFGGELSQNRQISLFKETTINFILALILILKTFGKLQTFHFLDHFVGLCIFAVFTATFNTTSKSREYMSQCFDTAFYNIKYSELFNAKSNPLYLIFYADPFCQKSVIEGSLYTISIVLVILALVEVFLKGLGKCCLAYKEALFPVENEIKIDRQVIRRDEKLRREFNRKLNDFIE